VGISLRLPVKRGKVMPKLTKRGRVVLLYAPAALALLSLLVWISSRLWWTGSGYCIGTLASCFSGKGGGL
jgi:hypothetical protein